MTKLIKFSGRALGILVEWILLLSVVFAFLIRSPAVQTYLAKQATDYLSRELNTKVSIEKVSIVFINRVAFDNFCIEDQQGDTLVQADRLIATVDKLDIAKNKYSLGQITLRKPTIWIKKDEAGIANFEFIRTYFSSPKKKKKTVQLSIDAIVLEDGKFRYDDYRKKPIEKGIDYWHLATSNIQARIENIEIIDRNFKGNIISVSAKDKSGFELKDLEAKASITSKKVHLGDLILKTDQSSIYSHDFNLISPSYYAYYSFVDSVAFKGRIDSSSVELTDIVYFAPQLSGMSGKIDLSGSIRNKVPDLEFKNVQLSFGERSTVKGHFSMDDYRQLEKGYFDEQVEYAYLDVRDLLAFNLPESSGMRHIPDNKYLRRIDHFETEDLIFRGGVDFFTIFAKKMSSGQGEIIFHAPLEFKKQEDNGYIFTAYNNQGNSLSLNAISLNHLLERSDLGIVNGSFDLVGKVGGKTGFELEKIEGTVDRFDYLEYPYSGIKIFSGEYKDEKFTGKIDIKDDYLDLAYDGEMDFKGQQHLLFSIDLADAFLDKLNVSKKPANLSSKFKVNLTGSTANEMTGSVVMDGFFFSSNGKEIYVPEITLDVSRSAALDRFVITSDIGNAVIEGKIDLENLSTTIKKQLGNVFPSLFELNEKEQSIVNSDRFTYSINLFNIQPVLDIMSPGLGIAKNTYISGNYIGEEEYFTSVISSDSIRYGDFLLRDARIDHRLDSVTFDIGIRSSYLNYGDTLNFSHFNVEAKGEHDQLFNTLTWDDGRSNFSEISWSTEVYDWNHFEFCIDPSYFFLQDRKWSIQNESNLKIEKDTVQVNYFELARGNQILKLNGMFSNNPKHHLNFNAENFDLTELSGVFLKNYHLDGILDGWGFISTPFTDFNFEGDAVVHNLFVNDQEVGDIYLQSFWVDGANGIFSTGDLIYRGEQTFEFTGHYYLDREENNLDYDLLFENTSIEVANAFLDPEVLSQIRGLLNGKIKLTGTPAHPITNGSVLLQGASAYVDFLGSHFNIEGEIGIDEYGFYADNIPVFDEEGNAGSLIGSVYHNNYKDFSFDLQFDLENDAFNKDPLVPWRPLPLDKFIIMNAAYSPDVLYYGTGVGTGTVNIFGYTNNLEISVDLTTKKGTELKIPMYGMGEIDEESSFIVFKDQLEDTLADQLQNKFDLTGVSLDLNFHATPDAEVQIIFDENIGDIITATGSGDINIGVNNLGEVTMNGTYTVENGIYDFALGVIKKQFHIQKGGRISWTGDPYDALLDLKTYYKVNANISAISDDQLASGSGLHQPVLCYLNLTESLLRPSIGFDIKAPEANEIAKSLINRITADRDELNRQFFSLLLFRKFQPLNKSSYSGSVGAELLTNQINSILSTVSDDYDLGVNFDSDQYSGDKQYEFVVSRTFLNDRLIITGSFGVENSTSGNAAQTDFIGDVSVEYLINESGTFRGKIFNESNDRSVVLQSSAGRFTQGIGVTYKEDFNNTQDLKLIQYFLDIFRPKGKKRYMNKRKKQQRKVPLNTPVAILED